ncbi:outer membrane beta-barrel protein [Ferruginibacter profundus]
MKKLLIMAIALLVSGALQAQETAAKTEKKSFLVLHGGAALPVGDFSSNNTGNDKAGFATTGYTINLNYGYHFEKTAGITASVFYNHYNTHNFSMSFVEGTGTIALDMDHWKFYGITAGPMLSIEVSPAVCADLKVMGGIANANSPKITYQGIVMAEGDWSWAPIIQGGVNLRINTGSPVFVFVNADYQYLKPKFTYNYSNIGDQQVTDKIAQPISAVNASAGIGINF